MSAARLRNVGGGPVTDDTRDIAIETRAALKHLSDQVASMAGVLAEIRTDLDERRGADKLANTIRTVLGGGAGAALTMLASKLTGIPLPK